MEVVLSVTLSTGLEDISSVKKWMNIVGSLSPNLAMMVQVCMVCHSIFKVLYMKKKITIFLAMLQMTILGVAQTPNDSCCVRKDSLCQNQNRNKPDSINLSLRKFYFLQMNVTDKQKHLPKINFSSKDFYREKFSKLNLIDIIGSHLSK